MTTTTCVDMQTKPVPDGSQPGFNDSLPEVSPAASLAPTPDPIQDLIPHPSTLNSQPTSPSSLLLPGARQKGTTKHDKLRQNTTSGSRNRRWNQMILPNIILPLRRSDTTRLSQGSTPQLLQPRHHPPVQANSIFRSSLVTFGHLWSSPGRHPLRPPVANQGWAASLLAM